MATVTGLTASRMLEIEGESVVDGEVIGGNLILTKHNGSEINAGPVIGPPGPGGPRGLGVMPGEIRLWPNTVLPDVGIYSTWAWANGDIFNITDWPAAAANIATAWRTAMGLPDPGAGKFRVPDLRGLVPAGPDAMPLGGARANRMTRAVAITIAAKTGEETHIITVPEAPVHNHPAGALNANGHRHPVRLQLTDYSFGAKGALAGMGSGGIGGIFDFINSVWPTPSNQGTISGTVDGGTGTQTQTLNKYRSDGTTEYASQDTGALGATPVSGTTGNSGSGTGHETVQPTIMVPYIVFLG